MSQAFGTSSINLPPKPKSCRLSLVFFSRSLLIGNDSLYVGCGTDQCSFLHTNIQVFPHHLLKRLSFSTEMPFAPLTKATHQYSGLCGSAGPLSIPAPARHCTDHDSQRLSLETGSQEFTKSHLSCVCFFPQNYCPYLQFLCFLCECWIQLIIYKTDFLEFDRLHRSNWGELFKIQNFTTHRPHIFCLLSGLFLILRINLGHALYPVLPHWFQASGSISSNDNSSLLWPCPVYSPSAKATCVRPEKGQVGCLASQNSFSFTSCLTALCTVYFRKTNLLLFYLGF